MREKRTIQYAIISFNVKGIEYTDDRIKEDEMNLGNTIEIYCKDYPNDGEDVYKIWSHADNRIIYTPLFVLSTLIVLLRFKDKIFRVKEQN